GDWCTTEIAPLPPGAYRIAVVGESVVPVSDAFIVVGSTESAQAGEGGVRLTRRVRGGAVVVSSAENTGSEIGTIRVRGEPGPIDVQREPGLEQRYLNGRFPKHVRLGDVASLVVLIGVQQTERLSAALAPV